MTRQEAIDDAVTFASLYVQQETLNDSQAGRIGRRLFSNLKQADREERKESAESDAKTV